MNEDRRLELEMSYRVLRDLEDRVRSEEKHADSETPCSFPYGRQECASCMYGEVCQERIEKIRHTIWRMKMQTRAAYRNLEREIREEADPDPMHDRNGMEELLAKVLRREAASTVLLSQENAALAHEAEKLFADLYFQTGDPKYRDDVESCRHLGDRILRRIPPEETE